MSVSQGKQPGRVEVASLRGRILVVVTGPPASGKTTFAREVASLIGVAMLSKDTFKETLYDVFGSGDTKESLIERAALSLLGALAKDQLRADVPVIIESNFDDNDVVPVRGLIDAAHAHALQIHCDLPDEELLARFRERATKGDRHPGHQDSPEDVEEIRGKLRSHTWEPLELDAPLERVDVRDKDATGRVLDQINRLLAETDKPS